MTQCSHGQPLWAVEAGCLYALTVFVVGFVLGAIRLLLLVPRLGETVAVSFEMQFMLAASWNLSRWSAKKHDLLADTCAAASIFRTRMAQ